MGENNRAENAHLAIRRRERKQQKFSPEAPVQLRSYQQHLQYPAASDLPTRTSNPASPGSPGVGARHRGGVIEGEGGGPILGSARLTCKHQSAGYSSPPPPGRVRDALRGRGAGRAPLARLAPRRRPSTYQMRFTAKPSNSASFETSTMSSACAWAINRRSKGSLWAIFISPAIRA